MSSPFHQFLASVTRQVFLFSMKLRWSTLLLLAHPICHMTSNLWPNVSPSLPSHSSPLENIIDYILCSTTNMSNKNYISSWCLSHLWGILNGKRKREVVRYSCLCCLKWREISVVWKSRRDKDNNNECRTAFGLNLMVADKMSRKKCFTFFLRFYIFKQTSWFAFKCSLRYKNAKLVFRWYENKVNRTVTEKKVWNIVYIARKWQIKIWG